MTIPAAFKTLLLVVCCLLLPALAFACGGDDSAPAGHRIATYNERCPRCGAQWSVKVDEDANGPDSVEVTIENTGERGVLQLILNVPVGVWLDKAQAEAWRRIYPQARAERNSFELLAPIRPRLLEVRVAQGTSLPFTLRPGATWSGRFDIVTDIPREADGLIFSFGKIQHEITPPGLAEIDDWLTWDISRPYVGLNGEVRVTPIVSPPPAP